MPCRWEKAIGRINTLNGEIGHETSYSTFVEFHSDEDRAGACSFCSVPVYRDLDDRLP
ncbi:hypothetical protein AB4Z22_27565 [Paenibacillus sp. TAF58]